MGRSTVGTTIRDEVEFKWETNLVDACGRAELRLGICDRG